MGTLIVLFSDGRPIFFKQDRLGKEGKIIRVYKFRSMVNNSRRKIDREIRDKDPELIKYGYFIRRFKIDELPQLWNVFKGEMSIVGPRPALPKYLDDYSNRQRRRLDVPGGLTCLAQIYGSSFLSWDERIEYDLIYIETQSFWVDIKIILKTFLVIFLGEKRYLKHPIMKQGGATN
jgi:lipopolysaccharide/colanic/teichoic acid biosynthesis glycosyltransferase